eukprot:3015172-Amphidinium_carterae.1
MHSGATELSMLVLDFSQAFWQLPIWPGERKYFTTKVGEVYYAHLRVAQGSRAVLGPDTTRLACYVDDPVATLSGPTAYQSRQVAHLILLWCALGLPLAFHKGQ